MPVSATKRSTGSGRPRAMPITSSVDRSIGDGSCSHPGLPSAQCAHQVAPAYPRPSQAAGRAIPQKILDTFASCPIPEVARLGKTLTQWRSEFLGYFDTDGANNGGTEAMNGLIELHRRIARGFRNRDNYRPRMLPIPSLIHN